MDIFSVTVESMVEINYIKMLLADPGNAMCFVKRSPKLTCINV